MWNWQILIYDYKSRKNFVINSDPNKSFTKWEVFKQIKEALKKIRAWTREEE